MSTFKKVLIGVASLAALAAGDATLANATNDSGAAQCPDAQLSGADAAKAGAATREAVGGGDVISVERSDERGAAVHEAKIRNAGTVAEVQLDRSYTVLSQQADDDQVEAQGRGDGDGEINDDGN